MSPRRSSRARTSQPSPLVPTQTTSSSSSVASDRAQRATRSHNKLNSPQRSMPRSQSQDQPDDPSLSSKPPPRRTRSGHNEIKEPTPSVDLNGDLDDDDAQEEDEITRCVCGQSEYPGLSTPLIELLKRANYSPADDQTYEQLGDVFLCCDVCHVWQHAGCVGILGKINEPESYYCDECRRDLHKVATSPEGQHFSRYAPVMDEPPYRRSPKPSTRNGKSRDRPRSNTDSLMNKRRVTMNSRNEDEDFARAIEESKKENGGTPSTTTTTTRNGKRGRDDDDEYVDAATGFRPPSATAPSQVPAVPVHASGADGQREPLPDTPAANRITSRRKSMTKRQRTDSSTPPHEPKEEASDEEAIETAVDATPKKAIRGAAARNHQAKEARELKEKERQAAASARKARSERRRGEDSDHEEPPVENVPSTAASSPPPEPTPASTRNLNSLNNNSNNLKKRPTPARRGRVGRNQYTRDRESPEPEISEEANGLLPTNPHNTRARSRSRSVAREEEPSDRRGPGASGDAATPNGLASETRVASTGTVASKVNVFDDGGLLAKPSKAKNFNEKKTSMNEMKKRVAAILEFVQRAQVERSTGEGGSSAGMSRSTSEAGVGGTTSNGGAVVVNGGGHAGGVVAPSSSDRLKGVPTPAVTVSATDVNEEEAGAHPDGKAAKEAFEQLSAAEMLVSLKTRLVAFEGNFGRWGDLR